MSDKEQSYETKLLRLVAAETFFLCSMTASREMFGKSYFALGVAERQTVDQSVLNQIGGNFQALTLAWFGEQPEAPKAGFRPSDTEKET